MAFPAIVGTPTESATTSAGTSHVINLPSGAAGNLFLLIMGKGTTSATINALAGWTELVDENQASGAFCAWHLCDGTEGATTTFTSSASTKSATIVAEISGQSAFAPQISAVAAASTNAPNPNTVTPTGGAKDYLWITWFVMGQAGEEADDDTWVNNAATGYSGLLQKTSAVAGTNIGAAVAACYRAANAASEDAAWPASSTDQTITWRSFTVAIHPLQLVSADPGALTETGVAATLAAGRSLASGAVAGAFALAGIAATLVVEAAGISLNVDPGAFSESGIAADVKVGRALSGGAAPGAFTESGINALLVANRILTGGAGVGSLTLSGVDATLTVTPVGNPSLDVSPGAFNETGIAATLEVGRTLPVDASATFLLSGLPADLVYSGGGVHKWRSMRLAPLLLRLG